MLSGVCAHMCALVCVCAHAHMYVEVGGNLAGVEYFTIVFTRD